MRKGFLSHLCCIDGSILRRHIVFTSHDNLLLAATPFSSETAHTIQCDGILIVTDNDFDKELQSFATQLKQQLSLNTSAHITELLLSNEILNRHRVATGHECSLYTLTPIDWATLQVSNAAPLTISKVMM